MMQFIHLKQEQLNHRQSDFALYTLGIVTLGILACIVAAVAYLIFPFIYLVDEAAARSYREVLDTQFYRVTHFFTQYVPAFLSEEENR